MLKFVKSVLFFPFKILSLIFGSLNWTPPYWIKASGAKIFSAAVLTAISYLRFLETKPKRFFLTNILALLSIVALVYGARWYINQPKPTKISFKVNQIFPTKLDVEKPTPNPLVLEFSASASRVDLVGKEVKNLIQLSPNLDGKWTWSSDSRLEFQPVAEWQVGQTYDVNLDKKIFSRNVIIERYKFDFNSPKFVPKVESKEFYEDPTNSKNKQGVLKLSFTHPVDKTDLERKVSIKLRVEPNKSFDNSDAKKLGFKVVYNDLATEAYIRSDNISIPDKDGEVRFEVDSELKSALAGKGSENKVSATLSIPGVENYFKVEEVNQAIVTNQKTYEAERILTIVSSAGVSPAELSKNAEVLLLPKDPELYKLGIDEESSYSEDESEDSGSGYSEEEEGTEEYEESDSYTPGEGDCPWTSAGQVPDQAIQQAQLIKPTWLPSEKDYPTENSFKFEADVGRCVLIRVKKGTKSFGDYPLVENKSFVQVVKPYSQDLQITDKGSLLALNGDRKINVMSRGLQAVQFTLFRLLPNSLHHLSTQGFYYDSTFSKPNFVYNFGPENISEVYESVVTLPTENPGKAQYTVFDFGKYLDENPAAERGVFILKASGYDTQTNYKTGPQTERLVLVSNLGFLVKRLQDESQQVYVMSTKEQAPVSLAKVEVLGKNGQPVFAAITDENGKVDLPNFNNLKFEKYPTVFVVKKDGDLSFMPYLRSDRRLDFSRFDISGVYTEKESESLQAYIFSDRGIYRPSETAKFGIAVKTLSWQNLPDNIPFELSVLDPRGIETSRQKISFPAAGFQEFTLPISESAITGTYNVQLSLVRPKKDSYLLGSTTIRVEEFLPDRLKINAALSKPATSGWITPDNLNVQVSLRNLFGTVAEGNTIKSRLKLSPYLPQFKGYQDYKFFDPFAAKNSFNEDLGEVVTDEKGEATVELGLERFEQATYQLSAFVQGLEQEGGRFVATNVSTLVSPQSYLIGWKPGGDLSFIKKGFDQKVKLIAINPEVKQIGVDNLVLERVEERFISILAKQPSGGLAYQSVKKKIVKETTALSIPAAGLEIKLPSSEPGSYYYEIRNSHGLVLNTISFNIVGDADLNRSMERNAELQIKLSKPDYASEEEIEFEIQAPYSGSALVTIERDKVYAASWFKTTTNSSLQRIKLPKGIEGNAYLNVAFVRALDSKEIYTSPLSYAAEPFSISKTSRTEALKINLPTEILPGDKLNIEASSVNPTKAVIYAVDEGILQVARYKTPDPLSHFFRKRALEVNTDQIVDLLLPEYHLLNEFAAPGGDQDALLGKHRNPFKRKGQKPVIYWSGIVELDSKARNFSFDVPDYFNGSIKVYAVAVSAEKIGVAEKQVTVQGDLVISPNAPLFSAPGDEFSVSAVVANTKLPEGEFNISLQSDGKLEILSDKNKLLKIATGKDEVAEFKVKALDQLGSSDLIFRATSSGTKVSETRYTIDLSVRPPTARLSTVKSGVLKAGMLGSKEIVIPLERALFAQESERAISFSTLPLSLVTALSKYLEEYPHGCTEQVTSQAFPSLLFSKDPAFKLDPNKINKIVSRTFAVQGARQRDDGSFAFWPGETNETTWLNLHVARFLLEAKERGFSPPKTLVENSSGYLRQIATKAEENLSLKGLRDRAIAIYLLTRMGEVTTNYLQTLVEEVKNSKMKNVQSDISMLFIAASYKLLQLDQEADKYANKVDISEEKIQSHSTQRTQLKDSILIF